MVCKFNSNVTSYNDRNASFKIALSVRMDAVVFVRRAIMCWRPCFMTLALSSIPNYGRFYVLRYKREPSSSQPSSFWVTNITILSLGAKRLCYVRRRLPTIFPLRLCKSQLSRVDSFLYHWNCRHLYSKASPLTWHPHSVARCLSSPL
jgi:hypothetical protein